MEKGKKGEWVGSQTKAQFLEKFSRLMGSMFLLRRVPYFIRKRQFQYTYHSQILARSSWREGWPWWKKKCPVESSTMEDWGCHLHMHPTVISLEGDTKGAFIWLSQGGNIRSIIILYYLLWIHYTPSTLFIYGSYPNKSILFVFYGEPVWYTPFVFIFSKRTL